MTALGRRGSLAGRITLLTMAVTVITALVAGALSIGLIRSADQASARKALARVADATQATADLGTGALGDVRARRTLRALQVQFATLGSTGAITAASSAIARDAVEPADVTRLHAGSSLSLTRTVDGHRVIIEGRPTKTGAIVLVQRQSDALAGVGRAVRRILISLLVGVAVAGVLALLFARRLAQPLRRTAQAAHALASGRRDVAVRPEGPAEVADVGEAVNMLAANLAFSESRQRNFLMSVSHELRTPLAAITGYAESLSGGVVPVEDTARVGQVMLDESRRLDRLVSDLLDLARLDAADLRIDLVDTDMIALAGTAADVWSARCAAAGVRFEFQAAAPLVARTDPARLRQALDGLLENALRVTPAGATIVLAARTEPGPWPVVLEVRDGGPGLSDADLAVAFDRSALYERYRGVRRVGTGLGLAIVHGLVTRLGGTAEAGHAAEGGARFTIRLPWAPTS
ncbi:MAG: integral rane sensor signal transduction histidine kinase [Pseudonocardiales bacterium]|nr:integral rane sensor signal transduction histidine kinase [Pseudonocardiales bacterium]